MTQSINKLMRLLRYLKELAFQKGQDSDFPGKSRYVVMFNPSDVYKQEGRTAGAASHTLKHFFEFKQISPSDLTNKFNSLVAKAEVLYIGSPNNPKKIEDRVFTFDTILNSLDLINDKIELGKKISPLEQEIWNTCTVNYTRQYEKLVDDLISRCVMIKPNFSEDEITKLAKGGIGFPVKYHDINGNMYVDIPRGIVCTTTRDNKWAKTLFRTDSNGVRKQISKQTIAYPNIKKALLK